MKWFVRIYFINCEGRTAILLPSKGSGFLCLLEFMKRELTENEIRMLNELVAELKSEANPELSLEENMQISLADRVENVDEQKAVEEICGGIHEFDEMFEQLSKKEDRKAFIVEILNHSNLNEKTVSEQYEVLAGVLEMFSKEAAENPAYDLEELESFCIKKDGEVTAEDLEQIKELVSEYLDEFSLLHIEGTKDSVFDGLFESMGLEASKKLSEAYNNKDEKYYLALAIYILQLQGKLESLSSEMGARQIGAGIAAFMTAFKARLDGVLGKIPWEKVLEILKRIATAALTVFVCAVVAVIVIKTQKIVFLLAAAVFGYGILGTLAAAVLSLGCGVKTIDWLFALKDRMVEFAEECKDFAVESDKVVKKWILETAIPALKEFWKKVKDKVDCYIKKWQPAKPDTEEQFEEFEFENDITVEA